jgi:hypothetical protein
MGRGDSDESPPRYAIPLFPTLHCVFFATPYGPRGAHRRLLSRNGLSARLAMDVAIAMHAPRKGCAYRAIPVIAPRNSSSRGNLFQACWAP